MATAVVGLVLAGLAVIAIRKIHRDRKNGGCAGCPSGDACPHCHHHKTS